MGLIIGHAVDDVEPVRDEIDGPMAGLLCTSHPPAGLSDRARDNAVILEMCYASEIAR
jgi:hypothetical protein